MRVFRAKSEKRVWPRLISEAGNGVHGIQEAGVGTERRVGAERRGQEMLAVSDSAGCVQMQIDSERPSLQHDCRGGRVRARLGARGYAEQSGSGPYPLCERGFDGEML